MSKDMKYSEVRQIVYNRYHGKCAICGRRISVEEMCISLITPKSKGGYKEFSNMQAACETCARIKHDLTQEEFAQKIFEVARHNLMRMVRGFVKCNLGKNARTQAREVLKEYKERTRDIGAEMDWPDYLNLIDVAECVNAGNAVELSFRIGYRAGQEELKRRICSFYEGEGDWNG